MGKALTICELNQIRYDTCEAMLDQDEETLEPVPATYDTTTKECIKKRVKIVEPPV